jgi:hypothetical protein
MTGRNYRDLLAGGSVLAIGLYFLAGALSMRVGSAMQMGPGYFPMLVGGLTIVLGLTIVALSFAGPPRFDIVEWRPAAFVLAAIAGFAAALDSFGLIPAMAVGVLVASLGDRTARLVPSLLLAVAAALGAWLIFRVGLGLQMPGLTLPSWIG